uniref:Uncharacterized protein n=1 Tax=Micrurus surinamensis TaxID=129470 RepID=A0A2D4NLW6_MICSU
MILGLNFLDVFVWFKADNTKWKSRILYTGTQQAERYLGRASLLSFYDSFCNETRDPVCLIPGILLCKKFFFSLTLKGKTVRREKKEMGEYGEKVTRKSFLLC